MDQVSSYRVDDVIDSHPVGRLQIRVVSLCCLIGALNGFDGQVIGFLAPSIATTLRVNVNSFGPMFAAGFVGLMVGAMTMGPLGDRLGRKPALLISTIVFGLLAGLTGFVTTVDELILLRFLTGVGLGGALPNVAALATEYMPKRLSKIPASLIGAAIPAGAMLAGMVASVIVPTWGWRWMFFVGGIMPIALGVALIFALPESVRFLSLKTANQNKLRIIMGEIWAEGVRLNVRFGAHVSATASGGSVLELFKSGRAAVTSMLWVINIMSFMVIYFIISWMPSLLKAASLPMSAGIMSVTMFSFGGVLGALGEGLLMNRFYPAFVLVGEFVLFALLVGVLATAPLSYGLVAAVTFGLGLSIQSAQAGLIIFAVTLYPIEIRSTGAGWSVAIGIIGSIIGPLLGGYAMLAGWSAQQIFLCGAVPALCAAGAAVVIVRIDRVDKHSRQVTGSGAAPGL
jgi:AAHS family 4-hydroxybenzoate transporter-like MFS transporter